MLPRFLAALLTAAAFWSGAACGQASDEDAVFLVAHPSFRDPGYFHSVLIAAPVAGGGHVGVIVNRSINRPLIAFFPEHEPSKRVTEPVRYGGPFSPGALVAVVKAEANPGEGTLPLMKNLYIAFRAATIDKVIEQTPNDARYFVGFVGWRRGELKTEIERGLWSVLPANVDTIFQKDVSGVWEELLAHTRRLQAEAEPIPLPPLSLLRTSSSRSSSRP